VTPFDPSALVAMLIAFYPAVSGAAFAQARRERPEYFAGGTIFGSKGDKLRLPDLREFDCIVAAGGPPAGRRWTCSYIDPNAPVVDDPFALEEGPLIPLDEEQPIFPGGDPTFESIVAGALEPLDGADNVLDGAGQAIVTFTGADALDRQYRAQVEPAAVAHAATRAALEQDDPADVIDATNAQDPEINAAREDYVEDPPPDAPEPDPGDPPGDGPPKPPPPEV
jgi:hypothetical protein